MQIFSTTNPSSTTDIAQGVPDRLEGWENEFSIPKQYSGTVMIAFTNARIITNVRAQIVQDVATKMMSYCKYPSTGQYETVAITLVTAFPILKDSMGPAHVSTAFSACNVFYTTNAHLIVLLD